MKIKCIAPKYMSQFQCNIDNCYETCCGTQWTINLDKKTTKQYMNCANNRLRQMAKDNIKIYNQPKENEYSKIENVDSTKKICGFCNERGLCEIHRLLGEDSLSKTCYTYPRIINILDEGYEMSGSLSCPEIAKLVLFEENSMELIEFEYICNPKKLIIANKLNSIHLIRKENDVSIFWEVRALIFRLISLRSYSIEDRLILLGLFHKSFIKEAELSEIEVKKLLDKYSRILDQQDLLNFDDIDRSYEIQAKFARLILDIINKLNDVEAYTTYFEISKKCEEGFKKYRGNFEKKYAQATDEYMKREKEYRVILENYILNYIFQELYPFSIYNKDKNVRQFEESYILLVTHVSIIKNYLIGLNTYYEGDIPKGEILKVIQSITKITKHNTGYLQIVTEVIKENKWNKLEWMSLFIKS